MTSDPFVRRLLEAERDAVTGVIAFMSYNPSIGRVLQSGGVKKFTPVACRLARSVSGIRTQAEFDRLHTRFVRDIRRTFQTNQGKRPSYGQAAKPTNVPQQVFVDLARPPNSRIRRHLPPFPPLP